MTRQEAIKILMESPLYFRMAPSDRHKLVTEFCHLLSTGAGKSTPDRRTENGGR